jgi:hypothetical protein
MVDLIGYLLIAWHLSIGIQGLIWFALRQERKRIERISRELITKVARVNGVW